MIVVNKASLIDDMDALDSSVVGSVPEFTIRTMKLQDVEKCLEIWAQVELTEARSTVTSSLALDPNAFNVAEIKDSSEYKIAQFDRFNEMIELIIIRMSVAHPINFIFHRMRIFPIGQSTFGSWPTSGNFFFKFRIYVSYVLSLCR